MNALRCLTAMAVLVQLSLGFPVRNSRMSTIEKINDLEKKLDHVDKQLNMMLHSSDAEILEQELNDKAREVAEAMEAADDDEQRQAILEAATGNLQAMSVDEAVDVARQYEQMEAENRLETGENDEAEEQEDDGNEEEDDDEDEEEYDDEAGTAEEEDYNDIGGMDEEVNIEDQDDEDLIVTYDLTKI